jgi:hypothetical protein
MGKNRCDPIDTQSTLAALAESGYGLIGPSRDHPVEQKSHENKRRHFRVCRFREVARHLSEKGKS